jgi:ABC-2 type transport system ATP-binding protein
MASVLVVENLWKRYGSLEAVRGIDFTVGDNEIFALIGPNGAGKSTTLKVIATILSPTEGRVTVGGLDVVSDADPVRRIISYLPEEAGAYKNLTGYGYLRFMAGLYADNRKQEDAFVDLATEIAGLGDRLKDKVRSYSKGMTRKLLLARTMMTRPQLAILDEPTSGLDVVNALDIRRTIQRMTAEGMSVLLSGHNMLEIEYLSDKVAIVNRGRIYAVGTAEELKRQYEADNLEEVFVKVVE